MVDIFDFILVDSVDSIVEPILQTLNVSLVCSRLGTEGRLLN
jgi:hypothetical protein